MLTATIDPQTAHAGEILIKDVMLTKPGEHVLITADTGTDMAVVRALWDAAIALTDKVAVLMGPQLPYQGGFADPYISDSLRAAMANCDVWVELGFPYLAGSKAFDAAMENGRTRYYLSPGLTAEAMVRLFTNVDLDDLFAVQQAFDAYLVSVDGKPLPDYQCRRHRRHLQLIDQPLAVRNVPGRGAWDHRSIGGGFRDAGSRYRERRDQCRVDFQR